jgi:hypothetical protein
LRSFAQIDVRATDFRAPRKKIFCAVGSAYGAAIGIGRQRFRQKNFFNHLLQPPASSFPIARCARVATNRDRSAAGRISTGFAAVASATRERREGSASAALADV